MKKIKNKSILLLSASILSLTACTHDFGDDFNKDTHGFYKSDYKSLMAGAIQNFAGNNGLQYQLIPQLYVQHQSQVTYTDESRYSETPGFWFRYYVNQIKQLNDIEKAYNGEVTAEMTSQGSKENMIGVTKIFRAIIYKRLTDTFGDIPLSEAARLEEGIKTPKFDTQQSVYDFIFAELKTGRDMLNSSTNAPKGDLIYGGAVNKWKKLANSVLLLSALQLSKKYPGAGQKAAQEFNLALNNPAGVIETTADEAWFTFFTTSQISNPYTASRSADYRLSKQITESLKGTSTAFNRTSNHTLDRRLGIYASSTSANGLPYGYSSAGLASAGYSASSASAISTRYRSGDSPINLMTAGYTFLNRAEGAALGWSSEDAKVMLKNAIVLNYNTLDNKYITGTAPYTGTKISPFADAYANARVLDATTFGIKRVIGEEKWVLLFNNGFDAWSEWRRTGYPELFPAPEYLNNGQIPRRYQYPAEESNFNTINYNAAVSTLSPATDKSTSRFWWDQ